MSTSRKLESSRSRRFTVLFAVAAAAITTLSGCSSDDDKRPPVSGASSSGGGSSGSSGGGGGGGGSTCTAACGNITSLCKSTPKDCEKNCGNWNVPVRDCVAKATTCIDAVSNCGSAGTSDD